MWGQISKHNKRRAESKTKRRRENNLLRVLEANETFICCTSQQTILYNLIQDAGCPVSSYIWQHACCPVPSYLAEGMTNV
jgi:hypothetical protein